jgi:hypothetical protein
MNRGHFHRMMSSWHHDPWLLKTIPKTRVTLGRVSGRRCTQTENSPPMQRHPSQSPRGRGDVRLVVNRSPRRQVRAGTVRALDTSAALDCPRCSVELADRPTKKYTPQPVLQDEPPVQEEPPSRVEVKPPSRRSLLLAAILVVLGLGAAGILGSRFWPRSEAIPGAFEHPALTIESDPPGAAVEKH